MNIQNNPTYIDDEINPQLPLVDTHNHVIVDNLGEGNSRGKPHAPRPQEYYRGNVNITDSDGPHVLHPLPHGNTFMVTSSLMQMLTARSLFSGLLSEEPHVHITKLRLVCKSCVGSSDLDMDVIRLRVFPLSLMGEVAS